MAWSLGPVLEIEMKIGARSWQVYAGRSVFVASLLIGMTTIWWSYLDARWSAGIRNQAKLGEAYFYAMVGVQLALTMLVAPAATAGAVCVERSRGTLVHMLVTDLSASEIILGKLCARLLPTFALIACAWPVAALGSLLGGIHPDDLTMAFAITLAVGLLSCSLALALSTWSKSVHEVLMAVYTFWAVVLLAYPIGFGLALTYGASYARRWMLTANPFWLAFAPYIDPGRNGPREYGSFLGVALGLSAVCIALAVIGVRVNPLGEARPRRRVRAGLSLIGRLTRYLPGPSLDRNPVLWREWHRARSSRPMRTLMTALLLASTIACCHGAFEIFTEGFSKRVGFGGVMAAHVQTLFGLLIVAVFASLVFSEERRRGSLDVLLATPLSTRPNVWGKWLAAFRVLPLLAIGPTIVCWAFAQDDGSQFLATQPAAVRQYYMNLDGWGRAVAAALMPVTILVHGAWVSSLGLSLSVWIRRESLALSLAVAVYVLYAVGIPICALFLVGTAGSGLFGWTGLILASSPVFAVTHLVEILTERPERSWEILVWVAAWDVIAASAALSRLRATVRAFDRKLGRISEPSLQMPPRTRARRSATLHDGTNGPERESHRHSIRSGCDFEPG